MARPKYTSVEERGGLSRPAAKAAKAGRRMHNDDLLASVFGDVSEHFRQNPLDGETIIGAMPQAGPTGALPSDPIVAMSADDSVADVAKWFEGSGREGAKTSAPDAAATKIPKPMSIAAAAEAGASGLTIDAAVRPAPEIMTGLPGEDYTKILDGIDRPPNTY